MLILQMILLSSLVLENRCEGKPSSLKTQPVGLAYESAERWWKSLSLISEAGGDRVRFSDDEEVKEVSDFFIQVK